MLIDYDASVQQQALAAFSGEQGAYVALVAATLPDNWQDDQNFIRGSDVWHKDPNFKEALAEAEHELIGFDCLHHSLEDSQGNPYTPTIDDHLETVLLQAEGEYTGAANLFPIVKLAFRAYNDRILTLKRSWEELIFFRYDDETKVCYLDGNMAVIAFLYYNRMTKPRDLPDIPDPERLAVAVHNAHGYAGDMPDGSTDGRAHAAVGPLYGRASEDKAAAGDFAAAASSLAFN